MHLAHAARLLAAAAAPDTHAGLAALARAAGVTVPPVALARTTRAHLAADGAVRRAHVAVGPGPLRALLATVEGAPLRETAARLAAHLDASAPDACWLLVLRHAGDGSAALVAWQPTARGPRLAALRFDPAAPRPSDAETLRTLAARAAAAPAPLLVHAAWLDTLTREALNARFYRTLDATVGALADSLAPAVRGPRDRADLALLCATRLLFLAFLEAKGWLDGDRAFLARHYDARMAAGGRVHVRLLRPLFFGTLNTPRARRAPAARAFGRVPFLNGGLFAPTPLERRHRHAAPADEPLGTLVHTLLAGHRFTAREDADAWTEAAVDPEMLGRAFESLMAARDRRATGAFYTPRPLVEHATTEALRHALAGGVRATIVDDALAGRPLAPADAAALHARLSAMRLLDPACGSGAFLVHALERVADLLAACGDPRPLADRRHAVLTRSIFGVDVNPTAVWLCELRLWLSVVVEREAADPYRVPPLPNLDHNVRVGDALAVPAGLDVLAATGWGGAPWARGDRAGADGTVARDGVATLRARYTTLAGPRKLAAARRLDAAERARAIAALDSALASIRRERAEAVADARAPDLFGARPWPGAAARERLRTLRAAVRRIAAQRRALADGGALPFGFAWHFADAAAAGGFDLVIGNPPWVRPHAVAPAARTAHRAAYACARPPQSARARAFGAQVDLAALFTERALALTRPGGVTGFLVPAKLWRTLAGGALRTLVRREADVCALDDWSDAPAEFDAAVYPSLLVARRRTDSAPGTPASRPPIALRVHRGPAPTPAHAIADVALDPGDATSPWLLVPPAVRRAFDALSAAGRPLDASPLPRPTLGVKCGCNDAFLVHADADDLASHAPLVRVRRGGREGTVEREALRPVLRGEHLAQGAAPTGGPGGPADDARWMLWPHAPDGRPLAALPPHAARWLAPWRDQLARRTDARHGAPWWSVFRTAAARTDLVRVVWPDLARHPRARVLPRGDAHVPLNTTYALALGDPVDARAFAALLTAPPIAAWLAALAEPARGGYRRYLAWTVGRLPLPPDWAAARRHLAALGPHASPSALTDAVVVLYNVPRPALAPLLAWSGPPAAPDAPPDRVREPAWATRVRPARSAAVYGA